MKTRVCSKCEIEKPLTSFYYRKDRKYYEGYCHDCRLKLKREYVANHKEANAMRCKRWKANNKEYAKQKDKEYYQLHKDKIINYHKEYYQINKNKINIRNNNYYQVNKEKFLNNFRIFRENNQDYIKEYRKQYSKTSRGKLLAFAHYSQYRARKNNVATDNSYAKFKTHIQSLNEIVCYWCGDIITGKEATIEHLMPLNIGGHDIKENLVPACKRCNCSHSDKHPIEYLRYRYKRKMPIHHQFINKNGALILPLYFEGGELYNYYPA